MDAGHAESIMIQVRSVRSSFHNDETIAEKGLSPCKDLPADSSRKGVRLWQLPSLRPSPSFVGLTGQSDSSILLALWR